MVTRFIQTVVPLSAAGVVCEKAENQEWSARFIIPVGIAKSSPLIHANGSGDRQEPAVAILLSRQFDADIAPGDLQVPNLNPGG